MKRNQRSDKEVLPALCIVQRAGGVASRPKSAKVVVSLCGVCVFGIAIAAFALKGEPQPARTAPVKNIAPKNIQMYIEPASAIAAVSVETRPAIQSSSDTELERLKTRNRRLEALVYALRVRSQHSDSSEAADISK